MLNLQYINCIAMRNFKSFTFFLCFVLMHKFNSLQAQDTRQSILKVLADQRIAWNQGDLQTYMEGYWHSDSLVFIGKNGPKYGWDKNKGYGTAIHRAAIEKHGLCFEHRKSFKILPPQLTIL